MALNIAIYDKNCPILSYVFKKCVLRNTFNMFRTYPVQKSPKSTTNLINIGKQ